jgi:hypothetical protein
MLTKTNYAEWSMVMQARHVGDSPVVQTVFKDADDGWPMLTMTNYAVWSMVMQARHVGHGLVR